MAVGTTKVVQVTNIAPQATKDQMQVLFGYLGKIEDIRLYPTIRDVSCPVQSRICYIKFADASTVGIAQHMTNTVFIDRALIVIPMQNGEIPDEYYALEMTKNSTIVPGLNVNEPKLPPHIVNSVKGNGTDQVIVTTDPNLQANGLPKYPPLPATYDSVKIEETRRTILVLNVDSEVTADDLIDYFSPAGEVKYLRTCTSTDGGNHMLIEFSEQSSVINALKLNGNQLKGKSLEIQHATQPIVKPQAKSNEAAQKEIEEAMSRFKEAQNMINASIEPVIGMLTKDKRSSRRSRSRSGSRRRRRSRSRSRSRRSRSRRRRSSSRKRSRSRRRRSKSQSRKRSRSRSKRRSKSKRRSTSKRRSSSKRRSNSRRRSRSRSKKRSKSKDRKSRARSRDRRSRDRSKSRRSKDRSKSRDRKRSKDRDRKSRGDSKSKEKSRESKDRKNGKENSNGTDSRKRSRSKSRSTSHRRSRSRDRKKDKKRSRSRGSRRRSPSPRSSKRKSRSKSRDRDRKRDKKDKKDRSRSRSRDRKDKDKDRSRSRSKSKSVKNREDVDKAKAADNEKQKSSDQPNPGAQPATEPTPEQDKDSGEKSDNMDISNSP